MKIMHTDNFNRDYPDEKFVTELPRCPVEKLHDLAEFLNFIGGPNAHRYYKVVPDNYVLQPGFEP